MSIPLNFVDPNGRLITQVINDDGIEYEVVKNIPKLIYTPINSSTLAVTEDGQLFDMSLRRSFRVKNYHFIHVIDLSYESMLAMTEDYKLVRLTSYVSPGNVIDFPIEWSLHTMIPTISGGLVTENLPDNFNHIIKIRTGLITVDEGIFCVQNNRSSYRQLPEINMIIDATTHNLMVDGTSLYLILALVNDGSIRYCASSMINTSHSSLSQWTTLITIERPSDYRFIEFAHLRGLINNNGECIILEWYKMNNTVRNIRLRTIDIPLDCFRFGGGYTKSARNKR